MTRESCRTDKVRGIAAEVVDGSLSPLDAAKLIVQEECLLIPTAVPLKGRDQMLLFTSHDRSGSFGWKPMMANSRGGMLPMVRATDIPEAGIWAVSDPNGSGQRLRVGGAGVTNQNHHEFDLGVGGWRGNAQGVHVFQWRAPIARHVLENPDEIVGWCDVLLKDESFIAMPSEYEISGHYVSTTRQGHEMVATFPILGRAMLQLPQQEIIHT